MPVPEAKRRRTQGRDRVLNPNPTSDTEYDQLVWPAHERYVARSVAPLVEAGSVAKYSSPASDAEVDEIVRRMIAAAARAERAGGAAALTVQ